MINHDGFILEITKHTCQDNHPQPTADISSIYCHVQGRTECVEVNIGCLVSTKDQDSASEDMNEPTAYRIWLK